MGGFDDLENAVDESDGPAEAGSDEAGAGAGETGDATPSESSAASTSTSTSESRGGSGPGVPGPAFEFEATIQMPFYVREETRSAWERRRRLDVERVFVEAGVEEPPKREVMDAMVRFCADNPEAVARYVLEERGMSVPEDVGEGGE